MRTRVVHAASLLLVSALLLTGISSCGTTKPAVSTKPAMSAAATATTAASTSAGTKPSETIAESAETARPHYSMDLLLDTVNRTIGGTATVTVVNTGKDVMTGWFWGSTHWFWHTNWLIFEIWLLVFIMLFMVFVSFFTKKPTAQQIEFITFTGDYKAMIRNSWNKWDVIASLGVVVLCGLFYWYFW